MADKEMYRVDIVVNVEDGAVEKKMKAVDKVLDSAKKRADVLNRTRINPTVSVLDRISGPLRTIESRLSRIGSVHKVVIEGVDRVSNVAKSITSKLTSPLGLLGAGAGVFGLGKITLGAAMEFEKQQVSMEHWLGGNKEAAKGFTSWLDILAAKTPFEMGDLFPAASRAIGVSSGDISMAQRLVKLSADMAGLTPGKTVQDAMEALADAQMGEFERMKEFNMKFSKAQMDAIGGFSGFLKQAEGKFAGGAEALSKTAIGRISTITDTVKTLFRQAGVGALEAMSPRLQKITDWFDKNPDKVKAWRDKLTVFGRDAFEGILTTGEDILGRLMNKFEDPGFQKLDWGGKIIAILEGVSTTVLPKAFATGFQIGSQLAIGLGQGALQAAMEDPLVGVMIGLAMPGSWQTKLATAGILVAASEAKKGLESVGEKLPGTELYANKQIKERAEAWSKLEKTPTGEAMIPGGELRAKKETFWDKVKEFFAGSPAAAAELNPALNMPLTKAAEKNPVLNTPSIKEVELNQVLNNYPSKVAELNQIPTSIVTSDFEGKIKGSLDILSDELTKTKVIFTSFAANLQGRANDIIARTVLFSDEIWNLTAVATAFSANLQAKATEIIARMGAWSDQAWSITAISTSFAANLQNKADQIILNASSLAIELANAALRASSFSLPVAPVPVAAHAALRASSFSLPVAPVPAAAHAVGGIFNQPHFGLLAESGPEAYIPLSSRMKGRALDLWQEVGARLGVRAPGRNLDKEPNLYSLASQGQTIIEKIIQKPNIIGQTEIIPHAYGGIVTSPHLGLIGESGAEAIIPLSERMRDKGLNLWQKVGEYFGTNRLMPAFAGIGSPPSLDLGSQLNDSWNFEYNPVGTSQAMAITSGGVNVSVSGVNVSVNMPTNEIDEDELAWAIGRRIVKDIVNNLENRV